MASDVNQCNFIGRLGSDPELRYTQSNNAVANVSIAVGHKYKDDEHTEWVRLVFFGKSAEIFCEYMKKGSKVFVSGRMQTRKWTDQKGQDRYTTEIVVNSFQFLDSRGQPDQPPRDQTQGHQQPASVGNPSDAGLDDDIPFNQEAA